MSEARMCDRCGQMFSVLEDGWETYSATRTNTDDKGHRRVEQYQGDSCAICATINTPSALRQNMKTQLALHNAEKPV